MKKTIALSRPALSAIAAFVALSTPAAFAQEMPTVTMTPPVAPTTVPAPTITAPPTAETVAPQPVIRVPLDIAPAEPAPKAAAPKTSAPAQSKRAAEKPRPAAPTPAAPREAVAPVTPAPALAIDEAAPIAAPIEPVAEAAPAPAPVERAAASDSNLPWEIAGGAAALLLIGGAGLAFARRRRASNEVWEFDEAPADAEWVPGAATVATEPESKPVIAPQTSPTFAAAPSGSMGRHEAMAMAGPTPDNPFATLQKRLARARFLDRQERAEYEATLAAQKDMRRKPVSAWEIAQRETSAAPAEQEVHRLEPGRARKDLKPGWTRN
ncbi:hypothetical protein [Sphingopyxis sp. DBS4]|uniref:hypothetical protein n=1 Tax=Sphingopyxis sp. DBS4 TaxID=2968500 RepID=UPI0027D82A87|nr:hypothetical protein [Sphingopyxis sp. DBS4]